MRLGSGRQERTANAAQGLAAHHAPAQTPSSSTVQHWQVSQWAVAAIPGRIAFPRLRICPRASGRREGSCSARQGRAPAVTRRCGYCGTASDGETDSDARASLCHGVSDSDSGLFGHSAQQANRPDTCGCNSDWLCQRRLTRLALFRRADPARTRTTAPPPGKLTCPMPQAAGIDRPDLPGPDSGAEQELDSTRPDIPCPDMHHCARQGPPTRRARRCSSCPPGLNTYLPAACPPRGRRP